MATLSITTQDCYDYFNSKETTHGLILRFKM